MTTYRELRRQYMMKEITEEEYQQKKDRLTEALIHLYFRDYITLDELKKRLK